MTKIMLVGEAWGEHEAREGRPFVGPSGSLLNSFLAAAGIARSECYLTNVLNFQPPANKFIALCGPKTQGIPGYPAVEKGKFLRAEFKPEIDRLFKEITDVNPNLIVALGGKATWAICGDPRIRKLRGAPLAGRTGHKVLPTYHPAAVLREFKLRPIVFSDFEKIRLEAVFPEIRRPDREFWLKPDLADLAKFEPYIFAARKLSVDVETWAGQITCIGFSVDESRALVIPFVCHEHQDGNYWRSLEDELQAWSFVRRWLQLGKPIVGQNFLYDLNYIWARYGIRIAALNGVEGNLPLINDTMLFHHAQQPEMEKSLGFLGSIHTSEPSWKFMRKDIKTLKKED